MFPALDTLHALGVVALIALPYVATPAWVSAYGVYVAMFMALVIVQWVVNNGECCVRQFEANDNEHGTMAHFVQTVFGLHENHGFAITLVADTLYCVSAFLLAVAHHGLQLVILAAALAYFVLHKAKPLARALLVASRPPVRNVASVVDPR